MAVWLHVDWVLLTAFTQRVLFVLSSLSPLCFQYLTLEIRDAEWPHMALLGQLRELHDQSEEGKGLTRRIQQFHKELPRQPD